MFKVQLKAERGIPDFSMIINGQGVVWELKKDEISAPSALQRYNLRRAEKAGAVARLVSPKNFEECFKEVELLAYNKKRKARKQISNCWLCRSNRVLSDV